MARMGLLMLVAAAASRGSFRELYKSPAVAACLKGAAAAAPTAARSGSGPGDAEEAPAEERAALGTGAPARDSLSSSGSLGTPAEEPERCSTSLSAFPFRCFARFGERAGSWLQQAHPDARGAGSGSLADSCLEHGRAKCQH